MCPHISKLSGLLINIVLYLLPSAEDQIQYLDAENLTNLAVQCRAGIEKEHGTMNSWISNIESFSFSDVHNSGNTIIMVSKQFLKTPNSSDKSFTINIAEFALLEGKTYLIETFNSHSTYQTLQDINFGYGQFGRIIARFSINSTKVNASEVMYTYPGTNKQINPGR